MCVPLRTGNLWFLGGEGVGKGEGGIQMFAQLALQSSDKLRKSRIFGPPSPPPTPDINLS